MNGSILLSTQDYITDYDATTKDFRRVVRMAIPESVMSLGREIKIVMFLGVPAYLIRYSAYMHGFFTEPKFA